MHTLPRRGGKPIGFAHRGARAERRENTMDAFARALELGATGLESDAWITADGQVVLDHDGVIGPPWRRRALSGQARAELPAHIPELAELYAACGPDFDLSLDVKDPAALAAILAVADAAGASSRLWLCHHDWRLLAGWKATAGEAKLVESSRLSRMGEGLEARAAILRDAGIAALNLHCRDWDRERVAAVHEAGILAFGWDAQSRLEITRLLEFGIDAVYSDHVDRLMAAIASHSGSGSAGA
jgi:glycerophosphoryl diester phosphodiesterase